MLPGNAATSRRASWAGERLNTFQEEGENRSPVSYPKSHLVFGRKPGGTGFLKNIFQMGFRLGSEMEHHDCTDAKAFALSMASDDSLL